LALFGALVAVFVSCGGTTKDGADNPAPPSSTTGGVSAPPGSASGGSGGFPVANPGGPPVATGGAPGTGGVRSTGGSPSTGGIPGTGGTLSIGGIPSIGGASSQCQTLRLTPSVPNVVLVIDRSLSMMEIFGSVETRWEAMQTVLLEQEVGLISVLDGQARLGMVLFTGPQSMPIAPMPPPPEPPECPILSEVPVAADNRAALEAAYLAAEPLGTTPTGESLERIWPELAALDEVEFPGPRVMVLATDGEPNTCADVNDTETGRSLSEAAITAANEAGVRTFVLSVGSEISDEHLKRIANLGQGLPADDETERFLRVDDRDELSSALQQIFGELIACSFELNVGLTEERARMAAVRIDDDFVTYGDPDGWRLDGASRILFSGAACDRLGSASNLQVDLPCGPVLPLP
jgi:hypothetical protein